MPSNELICPACSSRFKRPASLRDGEMFECPMCAEEFRVGGGAGTVTAQKPARPRVDELEEIDEEPGEELEVLDEGRPGERKKRKRRKSGAVELGRWISLGFTHWIPMVPPSIGFCLLYVILYILVSLVFGLLALIPVIGVFLAAICILSVMVSWSAGMTLVCIQQLKGRRWRFGEFFSGSQWWMPLLLNWILLELIYFFFTLGPGLLLGWMMHVLNLPDELGRLVGSAVGFLLFLAVYPLTWMFSWQLILDGNYGPMEAITENIQMALPHYWKLLPLALLTLFIRGLGFLLCGVGFVAAWPLAVLIESAAYLRLTGQRVAEKA
ncbi:MAG TPA: hypothetical protein VMG10_02715 [Gemmataceae bacterium]|nr:hypothetical protein [Gemmataceae bacterium]